MSETTQRELILQAFFEKLEKSLGIPKVYRNRDTDVPEDQLPAVIQRDGGMSREYDACGLLRVTMRIDVECYVTAESDEKLGAAISDLYGKVTKAALVDTTLGGLAIDVMESDEMMGDPQIASDNSGVPHAGFLLSFAVQFFLVPGDPYTQAP